MEVLELPSGSEVITTPFTFASTVHAIVRRGLIPVFCDIKPDDYTMDPDKLEALITPNTSAILPVHVYGNVCDTEALEDIASRHGLKLIFDASHAFGEEYKGRGIMTYGDVSTVSFHATKVFDTIEGGAICHDRDDLVERLTDIKNFGIRGPEEVVYPGGNAKLNEFSAAMGICNLKHIDELIDKRRLLTLKYNDLLADVPGLKLNSIREGVRSNYAYYPVRCDDREGLFAKLKDNGVDARKYFFPIASEYECYKSRYDSSATPVALDVSRRVITLPLFPDMSLTDVERVCSIIRT
jgi:dTDP-4-amino-4,6-dideoxygalactose transaminase